MVPKWFIYALIAVLLWGIVPILEKTGIIKTDPLTGLFVRCIGSVSGAIFLIISFPLVLRNISRLDFKTVICLVVAGLIGTVIGQAFNLMALKSGPVSSVTPFIAGGYPLLVFILGIIIFSERVTLVKIVGIILILCGLFLLTRGYFQFRR